MPKDPETGWTEADVMIGRQALTFAQSLCLRVAVSSMRIMLQDDACRAGIGPIVVNYDAHLSAIEAMLIDSMGAGR